MSSNIKSLKSSQSESEKRLTITSGDSGQPNVISGLGNSVVGRQADPSRTTATLKVFQVKKARGCILDFGSASFFFRV